MVALGFWICLFSAIAIIVIAGKLPERIFVGGLLLGSALTFVANSVYGLVDAYPIVIGIDVAIWAFSACYVFMYDRFWPIWFAGFHTITVATEMGSLIFPAAVPHLYIAASGFWALPALGSFAFGVMRDYRARSITCQSARL